MGRPLGQLEKSLAALTIGVAQAKQQRDQSVRDGHTGEFEQQLRLDISGTTPDGGYAFVDRRVNFDIPFLYAPLQRQMPWGTPQFYCGVEMTQTTSDLVLVHAHVLRWTINEMNWCTGAVIRFAASAPNGGLIPFSASVHLTFQGFGTHAEQEED